MSLKPWQGLLLLCLLVFFPIFGLLNQLPIRLWDESRLVLNALEMYDSGNWLVTTYNGEPDFWNAKPPLMIWLQVFSMKLFGINELAVRLPGSIAAFVTCLFLYWFFAKKYNSVFLGIMVPFVLVTCQGYVRLHGTRTGDYDGLLVMFTTLYSFCYFLYLEENKSKYLYATIIFLTLGSLTKGIAPLILLPAIFIYTLTQKKVLTVLRNPHLYAGIGIFLLFVVGYYLLREHYNPGYIINVYDNEIGGRFSSTEGHNRYENLTYYYDFFLSKTFRVWWRVMLVGVVLGLFTKDKFLKRVTGYSLLLGLFYFAVVSKSMAKAEWYDMAVYPFVSVVTAIGIYLVIKDYLLKVLPQKNRLNYIISGVLLVAVCYSPAADAYNRTVSPEIGTWSEESHNVTMFLKEIFEQHRNGEGLTITYNDYHADVEWYLRVLERQGRKIPFVQIDSLQPGQKVIAFQEPERTRIENFYNFTVSDIYGNTLRVYTINGKK